MKTEKSIDFISSYNEAGDVVSTKYFNQITSPEPFPCDDLNPAFILQQTWTALLVDVVAGRIDLKKLAMHELSNRGLDASGVWVGFDKSIK